LIIFGKEAMCNLYGLHFSKTYFMPKFGELISFQKPVLINFYADYEDLESTIEMLRSVVAGLGDSAKVIKIDITKNQMLANALRVKGNPTFMIYKDGEMKWRQTGGQEASTLIALLKQYM
jgi:thioredoxin 1